MGRSGRLTSRLGRCGAAGRRCGRRFRSAVRGGGRRQRLRLPRLLKLLPELLLVAAQLGEGDLTDRRRHLAHLLAGHQRQQVVERHLLEQGHVEDGAVRVAAEHEDAVIGEDEGVVAAGDALAHVLLEEAGAGGRVVDDLDGAPEEAHLLVEQRRDRLPHERQRAGVGLVRVHDRVHVRPLLVHGGVHARLDGGLALALETLEREVEDADVRGRHLGVVVVGGRDREGVPPGDAHGDVAFGSLEVAALEQRPARGDDLLSGGGELPHHSTISTRRIVTTASTRPQTVGTRIAHQSSGSGPSSASADRTALSLCAA